MPAVIELSQWPLIRSFRFQIFVFTLTEQAARSLFFLGESVGSIGGFFVEAQWVRDGWRSCHVSFEALQTTFRSTLGLVVLQRGRSNLASLQRGIQLTLNFRIPLSLDLFTQPLFCVGGTSENAVVILTWHIFVQRRLLAVLCSRQVLALLVNRRHNIGLGG